MAVRVLRVAAVGSVAAFAGLAALFIVGETLADPGGWKAVGLIASWAVPLIVLATIALARPRAGAVVLPVVLVVVAGATILDEAAGLVDRDEWGPVASISMFAVLVPCGLLGRHRALEAGMLLLLGGAAQLVATVAHMDRAGGQGLRSALGGSTGVLVVPFLVLSALFLAVAVAERRAQRRGPSDRSQGSPRVSAPGEPAPHSRDRDRPGDSERSGV